MKKILLLLIPLYLVGCATFPHVDSLKPAELRTLSAKRYTKDYREVFDASVKALERIGCTINSAYESTGLIQTKQKGTNPLFLIFLGGCSRPYYDVSLEKIADNTVEVVASYHHIVEDVTRMKYDGTGDLGKEQYQKKINLFFEAMDAILQGKMQ